MRTNEFPSRDDIENNFTLCLLITAFTLIVSLGVSISSSIYFNYKANVLQRDLDRLSNGAHVMKVRDFYSQTETAYINVGMVEYVDSNDNKMYFPAYLDEKSYSPYLNFLRNKVLSRIRPQKNQ